MHLLASAFTTQSVLFSHQVVSDSFAIPRTIALLTPLSMGFRRHIYESGQPFPYPGALPDPGIKPMSSSLADGFFTTEPPGKPRLIYVPILTTAIFLPPLSTFCLLNLLDFKLFADVPLFSIPPVIQDEDLFSGGPTELSLSCSSFNEQIKTASTQFLFSSVRMLRFDNTLLITGL